MVCRGIHTERRGGGFFQFFNRRTNPEHVGVSQSELYCVRAYATCACVASRFISLLDGPQRAESLLQSLVHFFVPVVPKNSHSAPCEGKSMIRHPDFIPCACRARWRPRLRG
jgi:hypothetical protein